MPFNKKNLTIQTNTENTSSTAVDTDVMHDKYHSTPRTEASTPDMNINANNNNTRGNNMPATPVNVRGRSDLRSPGISKTPSNAAGNAHKNALRDDDNNDNAPMPSFITQTDRYGNSTTPRPGTGNSNNSSSNHNNIVIQETNTDETDKESSGGSGGHRHESVDACDTLLESLRMMCCCILPDSSSHSQVRSDKDAKENDLTSVYQYPSSDGDTNMNRNMNMNANGINHSQNYNYNHNRNSSLSGNLHSQAQATGTGVDHNNTQTINTSIMSPQQIVKEDVDGSHDIKLLPDLVKGDGYHGKKCLVLDLDETLVHSSFRAVPGADFVIPVQIEDIVHFVYVMKRPGVDEFLIEMAKHYEIVVYTASLNKYADPLLDLLDPNQTIRYRLFRESCVYYEGSYVKDLSLLNRDLSQSIIVDNSAASYIFHPENAIDCSSFIDDPMDRELIQIGSFLKGIKNVDNVRGLSNMWREWPRIPNVRGVDFPTNMSTSIGIVGSYDEYDEDERQMSEPVQV